MRISDNYEKSKRKSIELLRCGYDIKEEKVRDRIIFLVSLLYCSMPREEIRKYVDRCFREAQRRVYVLMIGKSIHGVVVLLAFSKRKSVSLMEFVVWPQGQGYGSLMMELLVRKLGSEGFEEILIPVVLPRNAVREFFKKFGFKEHPTGGMTLTIKKALVDR